jgi:hypothetical protein
MNISNENHDDHFRQTAADIEWMTFAANQGWPVLTKDKGNGPQKRQLFQRDVFESKAATFVLMSGNLRGKDMGIAFVKAHPQMLKVLEQCKPPFIAKVYRNGTARLFGTFTNQGRMIRQ